MLWTTLKGLLRPQVPAVRHRARRHPRRRVHGRHARAHRHRHPDLRRPVRRRLRGHRRRRPRRRRPSRAASERRGAAGRVDDVAGRRRCAASTACAAAEGWCSGYARLIGKDGKALGNPANGAPTLGAQLDRQRRAQPVPVVAGAGRPESADEVVIDAQERARSRGLRARRHRRPCWCRPARRSSTVVGIAAFGDGRQPRRRDHRAPSIRAVAQRLLGRARQVRRDLRRRRRRASPQASSPPGWPRCSPPDARR